MHTHNLLKSARSTFVHTKERQDPPAVTLAVASRSAADERVRGGDVVDIVVRPDGTSSVLVADLSSKGVPSIAHANQLRRAFRRAALNTTSPSRMLSQLNLLRFAGAPRTLGVVFATAFVATIERQRADLTYASAGHGQALITHGSDHRHLDVTGSLLGVIDNATFAECRESYSRNSLLVVVTDGFSECRNTGLDSLQFGTAGIVRALRYDRIHSVRSAAEIVARSADIFTGGTYHDDATVAVIARNSRA